VHRSEYAEAALAFAGQHLARITTASEQMYFCGSPLAHVVQYEGELRQRREARVQHLHRARRAFTYG
jgi:hypothetical protein